MYYSIVVVVNGDGDGGSHSGVGGVFSSKAALNITVIKHNEKE